MASEFAELCERSGILKNNIPAIAGLDGQKQPWRAPDYAITVRSMLASTLTSYANGIGYRKQFREAKRALELALLLKPRWVPAWSSMAILACAMGDYRAAASWVDKVLSFQPEPNTTDPWEATQAEAITPELENHLRAIREVCRSQLGTTR